MFMLIAIDGPTGVGKSTVARLLAGRLDCLWVDTGAMFRCLAWRWNQAGCPEQEKNLKEMGQQTSICFEGTTVLCNGVDVTEEIRSETISALASKISLFSVIRDIMKQQQRQLVNNMRQSGVYKGAVLEGRDIGTVVLPKADFKFYVDADPEIRAHRRAAQLREKGEKVNLEEIRQALQERDQRDRSRAEAPLQAAKDAVVVDTGEMNINQVVERMLDHIRIAVNSEFQSSSG